MTSAVLTVDDLSIIHPARRGRQANTAVDRVTVTADAGEIVGIVGESGSGKTSLAMAVAGLGRVTDGVVGVGRVRPGPRMSREDRAAVQMVFQDPHASLDPRQSIGRGLRELRKLHPRRTDWTDDVGLLARVGLPPEVLDRLPHQISGGQAQRVSIARALLLRPTLLLADEPTSALDVSVQAQILKLLKELRDTDGLTILFISHDLAVVRALCDRVYVMRNGVVVESGRTAEVLEKPRHEYTRTLLDAVPGGTARTGAEAEPSRSRGTAPVLTEAPVRGAS